MLQEVLKQPAVAGLPEVSKQQDPRSWLEQHLQVQAGSPSTLHLTLTTEQPQTGAIILETLVDQFLQQLREQREQKLAALREQRQRLAARLPQWKQEPTREGHKHAPAPELAHGGNPANPGLPPLPDHRHAEVQTALVRAEAALDQVRMDLLRRQTELTALQEKAQASGQAAVPAALVDELLESDPAGKPLKQQIATLEGYLEQIKRTAVLGEKDPRYRRYDGELEECLKKIDQRRKEIAQALEKRNREDFQPLLKHAQEQVALLREREQNLVEEVRKLKARLPSGAPRQWAQPVQAIQQPGHVPPAAPIVVHRDPTPSAAGRTGAHDADGKEEALRRLGAEIHLLQLQGPDAVGVQRLGEVETGPASETRRVGIAASSGGGVLLFLLLAVGWLEFQGRRVRSAAGLARGLQIPVLGSLPAVSLPTTLNPGPASNSRELPPQSELAEAADLVRTVVLQHLDGKAGVLVVAGTQGSEGTTSTACQLALSLARAWRRTLLIDGHFRQPAINDLLQVSLEPGLSEVLRGEIELAEAVQPTRVSRLWFLPAGQWDQHALQALAQDTTAELFDSLHEQYDVVVIDAGPLLPRADALLLGQQADAVILAARAGHSRLPSINDAWYRLGQMGVPLLGVVVNGASLR